MSTTVSDYNLEFAHIYIDEVLSLEQKQGIKKTLQFIKKIPANKRVITTVLIDDYNPTKKVLSIDNYLRDLVALGITPDFVALESRLISGAKKVLSQAKDGRLKRSYQKYIRNHRKYPCSLLIVVWNLMRLGKVPAPKKLLYKYKKKGPISRFAARKIITILPRYFEGVENKALEFLKITPWASEVANIKHSYLDEFATFKPRSKKDIF